MAVNSYPTGYHEALGSIPSRGGLKKILFLQNHMGAPPCSLWSTSLLCKVLERSPGRRGMHTGTQRRRDGASLLPSSTHVLTCQQAQHDSLITCVRCTSHSCFAGHVHSAVFIVHASLRWKTHILLAWLRTSLPGFGTGCTVNAVGCGITAWRPMGMEK